MGATLQSVARDARFAGLPANGGKVTHVGRELWARCCSPTRERAHHLEMHAHVLAGSDPML